MSDSGGLEVPGRLPAQLRLLPALTIALSATNTPGRAEWCMHIYGPRVQTAQAEGATETQVPESSGIDLRVPHRFAMGQPARVYSSA